MSSFPWMEWALALAGGLIIGTASALLLWLDGRIAGITGLVAAALRPAEPHPDPSVAHPERTVSWSFIAGPCWAVARFWPLKCRRFLAPARRRSLWLRWPACWSVLAPGWATAAPRGTVCVVCRAALRGRWRP